MPPYATVVPPSPAHPLQNLNEIGALWEYVAARPHARVLEIGSLYGGTLWYWSHLPYIESLTSIDLPTDWPEVSDNAAAARSHWQEWFSPRCAFRCLLGDSKSDHALDWGAKLAPYDFIFIDGDHSHGGVAADWFHYSPMVRPGGIVAFHDTWPDSVVNHEPGVARWVDELRHRLPSIEWTDPDGVGICAFTLPQ